MIEYLRGLVRSSGDNNLVVETGPIALRVLCSTATIERLGRANAKNASIVYTRLVIRENNPPELFGFYDSVEREVFDQLCEVKGVSGRIALNILSKLAPANVAQAIANQDDAHLQLANGVGQRLAKRIVVELKDRMDRLSLGQGVPELQDKNHSLTQDAIAGLVGLGYKSAEARNVVVNFMRANPGVSSAADVIQGVLKKR